MDFLKFTARFGDEAREVALTCPHKNGVEGGLYLMIGKLYNGQVLNRQGRWEVCLSQGSELQEEDVRVLIEIVERYHLLHAVQV